LGFGIWDFRFRQINSLKGKVYQNKIVWRTFISAISNLRLTAAVNYELKLAWKYARARRKSLARFTALVAIVGIAAGVAALIVAQSLSRGFSGEMREKILANTAHIIIFRRDGAEISGWENLKANIIKFENVQSVEATVYESALLVGAKTTSYAVLRTVPSPESQVSSQKEKPETWDLGLETISIGAQLAEKTGLRIGDRAEIILPRENDSPKTSSAIVKDIFRTGLYDYDSTWIRLAPKDFARLAGQTDFAPTVLNVSLKDVYAAATTAAEIRRSLGEDFKVLDWQEANQPLFAALALERKVSFAIISLIIFIAVLNITTTLALLVNERRFDIAILRTCGARTESLLFIFLFEGLLLGITGIFFGALFGLTACFAANYFKLVSLAAEIYSLSYVPLRPQATDVLLIIFVALALSLLATFYPALRAARIKPLENLRNQ
jgi:lipoprotein-releasing system permease protein